MQSMLGSTAIIVDENAACVRTLEAVLRKWRYNVVSMNRPLNLPALLSAFRPAIVLLDIEMPGLDGPAIVQHIRSDPDLKGATVLLHASLDEDALARRALECKADGYVVKSRDVAALRRLLGRWLSR